MKKILLILALISFAVIGMAQDKTGRIPTGATVLSPPMTFSNSVNFVEADDTLEITVTNPQKFLQHQTFTYSMDSISGDPSVTVKAYGKTNSADAWTQIGSTMTWNDETDNSQTITSTAPYNYNYLKLEFIASSTTQKAAVTAFELKTANAFEVPATGGTITLSRPTTGTVTLTNKDNDANAAFTIAAGGTGALTLGDANSTTAIASSDWAISAAGAMTGIGAITADGLITGGAGATITGTTTLTKDGDNVVVNPYKALNVVDVSVNSASKFSVDSTGIVTAAGIVNMAGYKISTIVANTDASETLTAAQSGAIVTASAAGGATTITIPDPSAATVGVVYYIVQTADQDLILTATTANSNSIVCDGVATTDSVTISTGSHKIGAGMIVIGISATKWYVGGLNPESVLTPEAAD